jgi:hypothetical protein
MRVSLSDGRWFNTDAAESYHEEEDWNGSNHISRATGSQWEHERLYRTAGDTWVLHHWSQYQGSGESYEVVDNEEAARWLSRNDFDLTNFSEEGLLPYAEKLRI